MRSCLAVACEAVEAQVTQQVRPVLTGNYELHVVIGECSGHIHRISGTSIKIR